MILMIAGWQWIAILVVVLLLFGGKKIPELMRGIGKGVRSFKEGINDVEKEITSVEDDVKNVGKDTGKNGDYQK